MGHKTTDYGGGITSTHGRLSIGGQPYNLLGYEAIEKAYRHMLSWRDNRGLTTKNSRSETAKLKKRLDELGQAREEENAFQDALRGQQEALAAQNSYLSQMAEYINKMTEVLQKEPAQSASEQAVEPLKMAQETQTAARTDTARKQLLRRGLMSTMTRYGAQGGGARVQLGA